MNLSRELGLAVRRFADQQSDRFADVPGVRPVITTVAAVTGTAVDVTWRGATVRAAGVLASYTAAVNDRVLCLLVGDQLIVIDHIV